jgi:cytochrome c2
MRANRESNMKFISLFPFVALMFAASAHAADIESGNDLHFEHCTGCHDSSVYTRENRNVRDLAQLGRQVRFCKDSIGLTWFDDEVDDVIAYLNATYYHF